ncbi:MAG: TetR/AcrR family transcriptional regulator [Nitrospirota bacterium]|nr:TetR/AcrR family transcriptional regulator [Nitrospirota bacterium]
MTRSTDTRQRILRHATGLASVHGLEPLTIGRLADDVQMSKSGLFAHFRSKEALQLQVLDFAETRFVDELLRPALAAERGLPRIREFATRWLAWTRTAYPGACPVLAAITEFDNRPGAVRDHVRKKIAAYRDTLRRMAEGAIQAGHFRPGASPEQFAFELFGILLTTQTAMHLLDDRQVDTRFNQALDDLITRMR